VCRSTYGPRVAAVKAPFLRSALSLDGSSASMVRQPRWFVSLDGSSASMVRQPRGSTGWRIPYHFLSTSPPLHSTDHVSPITYPRSRIPLGQERAGAFSVDGDHGVGDCAHHHVARRHLLTKEFVKEHAHGALIRRSDDPLRKLD